MEICTFCLLKDNIKTLRGVADPKQKLEIKVLLLPTLHSISYTSPGFQGNY